MSGRARHGPAAAHSREERTADGPRAGARAALRSLQRTLGNRTMGTLLEHAAPGRPLEPGTRRRAEERFGHGFGHVRVHDDAAAHAAAEGLGARAFTYGAAVFVAAGERAAGRLLDHELAHVVQQDRGGARPPALDPGAPEERAAEHAAEADDGAAVEGATGVGVARQARPGATPDPEDLRVIQAWLEGRDVGAGRERTPPPPPADISYPPTPDAFPGYQLYYVYGDRFFEGKADFTPVRPYKSKHYWLIPQLRRTDPVSVYAYVAYNPDAQRNEMILDPRLLPFFFEHEFLFRAIAGASYPFVGEPEAYEVQSARAVVATMQGDLGAAARNYGAAVPNALSSRKFWTQTITSTAPLLKGAPATAPVRPPPTVVEVPPIVEVPPGAPAPRTVPVVVEGGGTATTSGGLSTVSRARPVVVEPPVQAQATARTGPAVVQESAVTPRTDVPLSRQGTWTTDPQRVVSSLPPGEEVTAASLRSAAPATAPGAVEGLTGSIAGGVAGSVRAVEQDRTPRLFPGAEEGRDPRLLPAPAEQGRDPRLLPSATEQDPTSEWLFPGAARESADPWLFPAPFTPVRDPLGEYLELAAGAPKASRARDRRLQDLHELQIAEYREHTFADRREDALEGHEITQNMWLQVHRYTSERGTGTASRWNPTIALPPEVHRSVSAYQAALGLYDRTALRKMGYREMLDLNELALREGLRDSGYSEATIDRVVEEATREAWEHAIFTIAKGRRRK